MGWIRIHGGEVRCLGQVPLVVMGGQSSLSPGHACFWPKSEIARALRQCTGLTLATQQHQQSSTSTSSTSHGG